MRRRAGAGAFARDEGVPLSGVWKRVSPRGTPAPAIWLSVTTVWVIFLTVVLSLPDDMRAGKSILALTAVLAVWYGLGERRRFPGPAWTARPMAPPHNAPGPDARER